MTDTHVSPELALVDPELRARLQATHAPPMTVGMLRRTPRPEPVFEPERTIAETGEREGAVRRQGRRRWRLRTLESLNLLAFIFLLGAAFLPQRDPPTLSAPTPASEITFAWPERRASDQYLLEIRDGNRVIYQGRLDRPYITDRIALTDGHPYEWRVFLVRPDSAASPLARGTFVPGN